MSNDSSNSSNEFKLEGAFIFWLLFSLISSAVFAKYSRSLCAYLFTTMAWLFLWTMFAQAYNEMNLERNPHQTGLLILAGAIGWIIGTFLIWRNRKPSNFFID